MHSASLIGLMAWGIGFIIFVVRIPGPLNDTGEKVGGDYFNFFAAGRMVLEGRGHALYDFSAQQETQRRLVADPTFDHLAAYVNPPILAVLFAPLSALPYRIGFLVYSLSMLTATLLAMRKLLKWMPSLQSQAFIVTSLSLLFFPVIRTITGGQNTALTLFILCGLYDAHRRTAAIEVGIWLAVLAYKPQFVLLFPILLLLQGQWKSVVVCLLGCVAHYGIGAAVCGPRWPLHMVEAIRLYVPLESIHARYTLISLREAMTAVCPGELSGAISLGLMAAVAAISLAPILCNKARPAAITMVWAGLIPAAILISSHAQYYDAGLLVFSVLLILDHKLTTGRCISHLARVGLLTVFLLFPLYPIAAWIGFQPLLLVVVIVWAWAVREALTGHTESPGTVAPVVTPVVEVSHAG